MNFQTLSEIPLEIKRNKSQENENVVKKIS